MLTARAVEVNHFARAKYYITPDGSMKLAKVQHMNFPSFRVPGFEKRENKLIDELIEEEEDSAALIAEGITEEDGEHPDNKSSPDWRNFHRAKVKAFDKILCNPDLDTFVTFTFSPEQVDDRKEWSSVYKRLRAWLSNRVERKGLKYVLVPERHKKGGIHLHAVMNRSSLDLIPATYAGSDRPILSNGRQVYNVRDFAFGFTSAVCIETGANDRESVAKYIFKYMGKQGMEGKIGGRYALTGGSFTMPVYLYGDDPEEFLPGSSVKFFRQSEHEGIRYREWSFI